MKVAHLISSGGLFGAEKVLLALAEGMGGQGVTPLVIGIRNAHNPHLEVVAEAQKRGIATATIESRGRWDFKAVRALSDLLREKGIDIVHSHNYKANFVAALSSRSTHIPLVATNHLWTGGDLKLRFYERLDAFVLKRYAKKVVAVAGTLREDMMRAGVPAGKIEVIFNGIRVGDMKSDAPDLRKEFGLSSTDTVIGVVARLSPEKGHSFLFKAAEQLIGRFPGLVFLLVGEGSLRETLEKSLQGTFLREKVVFAGFRRDMASVYKTIDIFVQSSLAEGLPISILEAMSLGKPIIATSVGATPEVIKNGETGLLVESASSVQLAAAIANLLADPALRARLGENAKNHVSEHCSAGKMVAAYQRVYQEVMAG